MKYQNHGNAYAQLANLDNHWCAFSKSIVKKLQKKYGDYFYIIIYWQKNIEEDEKNRL